jgi:hypothetical protein
LLGTVAFEPDGAAASPDDEGCGVSAANAEALIVSSAAKSTCGILIIAALLLAASDCLTWIAKELFRNKGAAAREPSQKKPGWIPG